MFQKLIDRWNAGKPQRDVSTLQFQVKTNPYKIIALTYADDLMLDGAGAQLQRIYGVYALARLLGIAYFHSPLKRIDYQGFKSIEEGSFDPELVNRWNAAHPLPSDLATLPADAEWLTVKSVDLPFFIDLQKRAMREKKNFIVRILLPYGVTDFMPEAYRVLQHLPNRANAPTRVEPDKAIEKNPIKIVVHMRRGDILIGQPNRARILNNDYYKNVIETLAKELQSRGLPFLIDLYTELPSQNFSVTPQTPGIQFCGIKERIDVNTSDYNIDALCQLPHVTPYINTDPIAAIESMRSADILVISRSSFSYLAGLLNPHGVVIYNPFWHSPLPEWIAANEQGEIDEKTLQSTLAQIATH